MSNDKTLLSRRTVLKGAGVTAGVGAVGAGSIVYSTQPALAAGTSIDASNIDIDENSESITEVNITPDLTLDWDNFSSGVGSFDITISATADGTGNSGPVYELTDVSDDSSSDISSFDTGDGTLGDTTGSVAIGFVQKGLAATVEAIDAGTDFPTDVQDGQSATNTINLQVDVTANNAAGNTPSDTDNPTFDVSLANPEATTDSHGTISTGGET